MGRNDARSPGTVELDDKRGTVWIGDRERVVADRTTSTIRFETHRQLNDEVLAHPYLGLPAAFASHWLGRQVLHGGAFVHAGRAWALLGDKEGGKSSTLGWLLQRGHQIVTDDLLVTDNGVVFSGPRCVDLRPDAAARFGGEHLGTVGGRVRWRLTPEPVPSSMPLAGVVHLAWGDRMAIEPLRATERIAGLIEHCVVSPGPDEAGPLLDLAALPTWRFVRPRRWEEFNQANERLLAAL